MADPLDATEPIPLCQPDGVSLISASYANQLIQRINRMGGIKIAPVNIGRAIYDKSSTILDFSLLDKRLQTLESAVGVTISNSTNVTPSGNTSISVQITNIISRLDAASATANCVGNVVTITFTI